MRDTRNSHLRIASAIVVVVATTIALYWHLLKSGRTEPDPARRLVAKLSPNVDHADERDQAQYELFQLGGDALPAVRTILQDRARPPSIVRKFLLKRGFIDPPEISPRELQSRACEAAYVLAERADVDISELVPDLQRHFTNGYADSSGGRALARAGEPGIRALTNQLAVGSRNIRDNAGWALTFVRTHPIAISALLSSANSDPDAALRSNALRYLEGSGANFEAVHPVALSLLAHSNDYVRLGAVQLLTDYPDIPQARETLSELINDPDPRIQREARRGLATQ